MNAGCKMKGHWKAQVRDVDGTLLREFEFDNAVTTAGLNDLLSVYFRSGTQKTTWYAGLIDNSGFSALSAGDTMSSHAGWTESVAYSETVRQTWTPNAPVNGIMAGTSFTFTANATVTLHGAFLVSDNTKGGTSGVLYCTGLFSSNQTLTSGQTLTLSYQSSQVAG